MLFNIPPIISRSITNFIAFAAEHRHGPVLRNAIAHQAQMLLNDPETAHRTVNAFRAIGHNI